MNDRSGQTPEPGDDAASRTASRTASDGANPPVRGAVLPFLYPTSLAAEPPSLERSVPSHPLLPWPGAGETDPAPHDPHEHEATLTRLALAARAGDRAARDYLYEQLEPNIRRMVAGCARLAWAADCPRREGRPWDREDLAQEAFLVFNDLIQAWSGVGPVTPYLFAYFPWRLRNAWRTLRPDRPRGMPILRAEPGLATDASAPAAEATVLLEALASELPVVESAILLLHVRDGLSLAEIGRRFGVRPRQVGRRWAGIKRWLRGELARQDADGRPRRVRPPDAPPPALR